MNTKFVRFALPVFLSLALVLAVVGAGQASGIPIITIKSVVEDTSVTIYGYNFPVGQTFTVRMGAYGSYALGGTVVGTYDSTAGSTFTATYDVPAALAGLSRIAIRLDSPQGYFSYNWFFNNDADVSLPSTPAVPAPKYPSFSISAVTKDVSVTVVTANLPADQEVTVRMGEYGTLGIGGTVVETFDSDEGGTQTLTFGIPAAFAGKSRIAIRLDCEKGYYAYNWFWNNTTSAPVPAGTPAAPVVPAYTGYPTLSIAAVKKDTTVTISGYNFPPDETFTVRMGEYGTLAIGGVVVDTYETGDGGKFSATFDVPADLAGRTRIAIRMDSSTGYYYAFNWFWNNTTN